MTSKNLKNLFVKNLRSPLSIPIAFKLLAWFGFTVDHAYNNNNNNNNNNSNNNNNNNNNGLRSVHPWYGSSPDIKVK